ncbi:MAG: DUF1653 domain-containing protein [Firmicutes bacterium]|nr:DUF1653 domain-containing protein [Bacillota bacterium]
MKNEKKPIPIGRYKHYTGYMCEVICTAKQNDTMVDMVVYRGLGHDGDIRVRPATEWNHTVFVNKKPVPRYEFME